MRRAVIVASVAGLIVLGPIGASAQMTPIVSTDIRAGAAPDYGCDNWDYAGLGQRYTLELVPGGSPSGNDSLRFTGIQTSQLGDNGWGCSFGESLEDSPPQGSVRYARWRIKYIGPINWRSDSSATGYSPNARTAPDKLFILGNTCESDPHRPTRIILWQDAPAPSRSQPMFRLTQNIGAGLYRQVPPDTWLHVQVKITSSSTRDAADGRFDLYINNNNESNPTVSATGIRIRTSGWGQNTCPGSHIVWGDGSYNPLSPADPTTNNETELADFEYDDQFDPNWALDIVTPNPPSNLTIS